MGSMDLRFAGRRRSGRKEGEGFALRGGDDQVRKADENMRAYFAVVAAAAVEA
jgi:hypothetical protein